MPLRVSGVPPLFEATTHSVSGSRPDSRRSVRAMPSGSVLSMKSIRIRSVAGSPSASATNIGPSAEPPMPMHSTPVYRGRRGRPDLPAVDAGGERLDVGDGLADLGGDLRGRGQVRGSAASSARPSGSRPGWRSRPSPAPPSPRTRLRGPGSCASRKPSSNPIRLTSSVSPSDGTRQRYC